MTKNEYMRNLLIGIICFMFLTGGKYSEQINGLSANERITGYKNYPIMNDGLIMKALSTPIEYRCWVIANKGWLLSAGFGGMDGEFFGGNFASPCSPEDQQRDFENYCGYYKKKFKSYKGKKEPKGLEKWLKERGLERVMTESPYIP